MLVYRLEEGVKQIPAIMRSWRGFWVVLDRESCEVPKPEAFEGLVVEVHVCHPGLCRSSVFPLHSKTVVLGGNFDSAGIFVTNGLVGAPVADEHLVYLKALGKSEKLVSKTNSKVRDAFGDEFLNGLYRVRHYPWVTWAIGQEDTFGLPGQHLFEGC